MPRRGPRNTQQLLRGSVCRNCCPNCPRLLSNLQESSPLMSQQHTRCKTAVQRSKEGLKAVLLFKQSSRCFSHNLTTTGLPFRAILVNEEGYFHSKKSSSCCPLIQNPEFAKGFIKPEASTGMLSAGIVSFYHPGSLLFCRHEPPVSTLPSAKIHHQISLRMHSCFFPSQVFEGSFQASFPYYRHIKCETARRNHYQGFSSDDGFDQRPFWLTMIHDIAQ